MISLQTMRDHKALKWPLYILFGLLIISFIFFYGWRSNTGAEGPQVEFGKIRAEGWNPLHRWDEIGPYELTSGLNRAIQIKMHLVPQLARYLDPERLRDVPNMAEKTASAADLMLTDRAGRDMGVVVTRQDVINYLQSQPGMNQAALDQAVERYKFANEEEMLEFLRQSFVADHTEAMIGQVANASLFELWQEYLLANESIGMTMAAYPVKDFESQVAVNDQDLADYLNSHKADFHVPAKRQYAYAELSLTGLLNSTNPTEEQIKAYYDKNQAKYQTPAGVRVEELLIPLHKDDPTTYTTKSLDYLNSIRADAAKSDNWTSFSRELNMAHRDKPVVLSGPVSDWLGAEAPGYSPDFLMAARTMTNDAPSTPMLDNARVVMFRAKERRPTSVKPLAEIHDQVKNDTTGEIAKKAYQDAYAKWRAEADKYKDIAEFAKAMSVNDELSTPTAVNSGEVPGVGAIPAGNLQEYLGTLKTGELSEPFDTGSAIAVVQLKAQSDAYDPPLAEVRDKVEAAYRQEKAVDLAKARAQQNLDAVRGGGDIKTILADAPIKPIDVPPFHRGDPITALNAPLLNFNQALAGMKEGSTGFSAYGQDVSKPLGYAVWKTTSIIEPGREQFAKDRFAFERDYLNFQQMTVIGEWLADQRKKADFQMDAAAK